MAERSPLPRFATSPRGRPEDPDFLLDRSPSRNLKATMHSIVTQWARLGGLALEQDPVDGWWSARWLDGEVVAGAERLTLAELAAWLQIWRQE